METYNEAQLGRTPTASLVIAQHKLKTHATCVNPYVYPDVDWYDLIFKNYTTSQRAKCQLARRRF